MLWGKTEKVLLNKIGRGSALKMAQKKVQIFSSKEYIHVVTKMKNKKA